MKKLLLALLGAFFVFPALAADWPIETNRDGTHTKMFTRMAGEQIVLNSTVTQDVASWSFSSSAVRICFNGQQAAGDAVYMRVGTTVSATQSSDFIDGDGNQGADPAAVLVGGGDGTDTGCEIYPLNVRGLVFHSNSMSVTLDVTAFD